MRVRATLQPRFTRTPPYHIRTSFVAAVRFESLMGVIRVSYIAAWLCSHIIIFVVNYIIVEEGQGVA